MNGNRFGWHRSCGGHIHKREIAFRIGQRRAIRVEEARNQPAPPFTQTCQRERPLAIGSGFGFAQRLVAVEQAHNRTCRGITSGHASAPGQHLASLRLGKARRLRRYDFCGCICSGSGSIRCGSSFAGRCGGCWHNSSLLHCRCSGLWHIQEQQKAIIFLHAIANETGVNPAAATLQLRDSQCPLTRCVSRDTPQQDVVIVNLNRAVDGASASQRHFASRQITGTNRFGHRSSLRREGRERADGVVGHRWGDRGRWLGGFGWHHGCIDHIQGQGCDI